MQCVILAAGRGTRMNHLTHAFPKPMLSILGKPKLEYTLRLLPKCVDEVVIVVGYLGEVIRTYFGNSFCAMPIRYVQQGELNGTAGALFSAKDILKEKFLVIMGDDLYRREDLDRMTKKDLAVLACEMENADAYGVLKIDGQGNLLEILERPHDPKYTLANTGAYLLKKEYFSYPMFRVSEREFGLPQTLIQMKKDFSIAVEKTKTWLPIGTPEALKEAQEKIHLFISET